jgi:phosphoesterase RecJ-like protein
MSTEAYIRDLLSLLQERSSFFITSHARPDGDAIGSSLGLMHLLESMGKHVTVAFAEPIPLVYSVLPGIHRISTDLPSTPPDAAILLECDSLERTSFAPEAFARMGARLLINIDHHKSGRTFADFNWIDPSACAVGAMLYDLAIHSGHPITPPIANCLYTAVLTDTGGFTYASTNAAALRLAGHLIECGADANRIAQAVYFSNTPGKIRLLGTALSNLTIEAANPTPPGPSTGGLIAWSFVTLAEMELAGATVEDCEGVVNHLIGIAGVDAAAFLREMPTSFPATGSRFRLSLRSKGSLDVAIIAERFGGGGHRNASGCTLDGPLDRAIHSIVSQLLEHTLAPRRENRAAPTLLA